MDGWTGSGDDTGAGYDRERETRTEHSRERPWTGTGHSENSPQTRTTLGRRRSETGDRPGPRGALGTYRATDGSDGGAVAIDFDRPHACLIVGKRGSGKSHTLGVVAEGLARADGVAPVVLDPMGELVGLGDLGLDVQSAPRVRSTAIPPSAWPPLVGLDPAGPAGTLVWHAADAAESLAEMREWVDGADAAPPARRGARNHLRLAASWGVFEPTAPGPEDLVAECGTVVDLSGLAAAPANAVCRAIADGLYGWRTTEADTRTEGSGPLPWLLLDEAHAFFDGVAEPALRTLLTRGRTPGVSLVAATQRPGALPAVAPSQADLLVAHRLTAKPDVAALEAATPTYLEGRLRERLPRERGCAVVIDDATESVHGIRVRERRGAHGGASPRARESIGDGIETSDRAKSGRSKRTETPESVRGDGGL